MVAHLALKLKVAHLPNLVFESQLTELHDGQQLISSNCLQVLYLPAPGEHMVKFRGWRLWMTRKRDSADTAPGNKRLLAETLTVTLLGRNVRVRPQRLPHG